MQRQTLPGNRETSIMCKPTATHQHLNMSQTQDRLKLESLPSICCHLFGRRATPESGGGPEKRAAWRSYAPRLGDGRAQQGAAARSLLAGNGKKGGVAEVLHHRGRKLPVLARAPATVSSAQFCLLCCQPEPVPRSLAARNSLLTPREPCRLLTWSGQAISTVAWTCGAPQRSITHFVR